MGETLKARDRRTKEGWFGKYIQYPGIDIGCQHDPVDDDFRKWDVIFGDGDATFMESVPDNFYATVYASHVLEHVDNPGEAIKNWYRILSPGGHLIVIVPHRDLYEKKKELPSHWNAEHRSFWLPISGEEPCTKGLLDTISQALPGVEIVSLRVLDDGFVSNGPLSHSSGEYSIEAIVKKEVENG